MTRWSHGPTFLLFNRLMGRGERVPWGLAQDRIFVVVNRAKLSNPSPLPFHQSVPDRRHSRRLPADAQHTELDRRGESVLPRGSRLMQPGNSFWVNSLHCQTAANLQNFSDQDEWNDLARSDSEDRSIGCDERSLLASASRPARLSKGGGFLHEAERIGRCRRAAAWSLNNGKVSTRRENNNFCSIGTCKARLTTVTASAMGFSSGRRG